MELSAHPLLSLVEDNANVLKSMLTSYIDDTVDYQFAILKNRILKMINNGLIHRNGFIDPLYSENSLDDFAQTTFTTGQSNIDHENASILRHSNGHLATAYEQNILSSSADVIAFPHFPLNTTQVNSNNSTDQIAPEQITFPPTANQIRQLHTSNNNLTYKYNEDDNTEGDYSELDYLNAIDNGIKDEEEYGDDETDQQIETNQDDEESSRRDGMQRVAPSQPLNGPQSPIQTKQIKSQIQSDEPIIQQSIPSTSGIRSSDRKRTPRKVFGDVVQSNDCEVKSDKRKSKNNSGKAVKKVKHQNIEEIHLEGEVDAKPQIVTLELNCTEPGCEKTLKCRKMWREHLSSRHGQIAYKQLKDNVRYNQNGQIEYPCTKCELVCVSQDSLHQHWREYHQPGKYECSLCGFVANFRSEVRNHQRNHLHSSKYQCTQQGCNRAFSCIQDLELHGRMHNGEKHFACNWKKCKSTFNKYQNAIRHVRDKHFHLPRTTKEQQELNIINTRDPKVFVQVCQG